MYPTLKIRQQTLHVNYVLAISSIAFHPSSLQSNQHIIPITQEFSSSK